MPGKVLKSHGWVEKEGEEYQLTDFDKLSDSEVKELVDLCQVKLKKYLDDRGKKAFSHRKKSSGIISGTVKYEVLKNAKFRCEIVESKEYGQLATSPIRDDFKALEPEWREQIPLYVKDYVSLNEYK